MKTTDFQKCLEFPSRVGVVYAFFLINGHDEVPFYVGQTQRFMGRMDEYHRGSFQATADFVVGEAVKYLKDVHYRRIVVCYSECRDPRAEEVRYLRQVRDHKIPLLNDLEKYDYRTADSQHERVRIHEFCDRLIASLPK
jgi:hypothetical protein